MCKRSRPRTRPLCREALILTTLFALAGVAGAAPPAAPPPDPSPAAAGSLSGQVLDDRSGDPIAGAVVVVLPLNRWTTTDESGAFRFEKLPAGEVVLCVHLPGFNSSHDPVRVPRSEPVTIRLTPDHHFAEEITVTALPWAASPLETPQSVDQVEQEAVASEAISSIGDAIAHLPGVDSIGTGDALGTPVIRGVSESRVRIVNDGAPMNHQQWSFRHSPNIEPLFAERIEVVRGPSSVMWGPDALGGVVNVVQPPLPMAPPGESAFHGDAGLGYSDNTGQVQGQLSLEGARNGFGWRAGLARRDAGDIETPAGSLPGTDFEQTNAVVAVGHTGRWGSARLRWNHWEDDVGFYFPEGNPNVGFRLDLEDDSYVADLALPTGAGEVEVLLSHQGNRRRAFPPTAPAYPAPAIDLRLETNTARASFQHREWGPVKGSVAAEYRDVENEVLGPVPLVPNYEDRGYSVMALEEARWLPSADGEFERLIATLGLRWDSSRLAIPAGEANVPEGFDRDYSSVTGSVGLVYRASEEFALALNAGRGWRPPNAFELFAKGDHVGVGAFQLGNPNLEEETAASLELSARYESAHWRVVATGFRSDIDDYIYLVELTEEEVLEIDPTLPRPVFYYRQADAVIDGLELSADVVPWEPLALGLIYSQVNTENRSTGSSLPQTPPDRITLFARFSGPERGRIDAPFVELESVWVDDGVPSGPDEVFYGRPFGAATDSYNLLNLRAGVRVDTKVGELALNLTVLNLLDEEYTDFLYPYKGFGYDGRPALNPGRDIRVMTRFVF